MDNTEDRHIMDDIQRQLSTACISDNSHRGSSATTIPSEAPTLATLPAEIKFEIFSYLLDGDKVRYRKDNARPPEHFRFNTTILLLNKILSAEGTAYLRNTNDFVLVRYRWVEMMGTVTTVLLPIVARGQAAERFQKPSLTVELHNPSRYYNWEQQDHAATARALHLVESSSFLLVSKDVPILCRALQLTFHLLPGNQIYILSPPGSRSVMMYPKAEGHFTSMDLTISDLLEDDPTKLKARQDRLMVPFSNIHSHGQIVKTKGFDVKASKKMIDSMTSRVVWLDAVGWDLLHNLEAHKATLDGLLLQDGCIQVLYRHFGRLKAQAARLNFLFQPLSEARPLAMLGILRMA